MQAKWKNLLQGVSEYYSGKIVAGGVSAKGVDWNSKESQELRFKKLLTLCDLSAPFSVNDIGCGYGALVGYLRTLDLEFTYHGCEVSPEMLAAARNEMKNQSDVYLYERIDQMPVSDYSVASGIFNVRLETDSVDWKNYIFDMLDQMNLLSNRGFAFNILTSFSDVEKRAAHLYYADPCEYFTRCKTKYSKNVALLHDYDLYEFTILVRKT